MYCIFSDQCVLHFFRPVCIAFFQTSVCIAFFQTSVYCIFSDQCVLHFFRPVYVLHFFRPVCIAFFQTSVYCIFSDQCMYCIFSDQCMYTYTGLKKCKRCFSIHGDLVVSVCKYASGHQSTSSNYSSAASGQVWLKMEYLETLSELKSSLCKWVGHF